MSYTMIRTVVSNLSVASHSPFETHWSCSIYTFYANIDHPVINTWGLMKNWWQFNTFKVIFRLTNARSVLMIQGNNLKCRFSYQNLSLLNVYDIMCLCWRNLPYHISVKTLIAFFFFLLGHSWTAAAVLEHVSKRTWIITQSICSWISLCTVNTHRTSVQVVQSQILYKSEQCCSRKTFPHFQLTAGKVKTTFFWLILFMVFKS